MAIKNIFSQSRWHRLSCCTWAHKTSLQQYHSLWYQFFFVRWDPDTLYLSILFTQGDWRGTCLTNSLLPSHVSMFQTGAFSWISRWIYTHKNHIGTPNRSCIYREMTNVSILQKCFILAVSCFTPYVSFFSWPPLFWFTNREALKPSQRRPPNGQLKDPKRKEFPFREFTVTLTG